jgi:glutathione-regulated potassium-efflux system ancillary protein KefC
MDVVLIIVAFVFGFAATRMRLPALVGYLVAGFVLFAFGFETTEAIEVIAEIGVILLLFSIGLKLKIRFLGRREVWATATVEVVVVSGVIAGVMLAVGAIGFPMIAGLDWQQTLLLGFVFAFSSTVFAIKMLEQTNETGSLSGRLAVGVLIVQDIMAVAFLVFLAGMVPSWWAIPMVIAIIALRPLYGWFLARTGHGELLVLSGFALAVGVGAGGFHLVGLEPELGALVAGIVVSSDPRAGEMADRLLDFKDFFLVGFFLSIGLGGIPPVGALAVVALMIVLLPIKSGLFFLLFTRFHLRNRTALQASLTLSSYSEFGLIVAVASQATGILEQEWVSTIAVVVASSFAVAAAVNTARYRLYGKLSAKLSRFESPPIVADDEIVDLEGARVITFGMGRVGTGAYDELVARRGDVVVGVERNKDVIAASTDGGRNVVLGYALDQEFWEQLKSHDEVELIVVAMDNHASNLVCVERANEFLPEVSVAAIARYPDQVIELEAAGVDVARNLYEEAGQGLVDDAISIVWRSADDNDDASKDQTP